MWLLLDGEGSALQHARAAGLGQSTVDALKAGIAALKRKRLGRLCDTMLRGPLQRSGSLPTPSGRAAVSCSGSPNPGRSLGNCGVLWLQKDR